MLILTWVGIIFVKMIMINIMPTHVRISIEPGIRELFLKLPNHSKLLIICTRVPNYPYLSSISICSPKNPLIINYGH